MKIHQPPRKAHVAREQCSWAIRTNCPAWLPRHCRSLLVVVTARKAAASAGAGAGASVGAGAGAAAGAAAG